MYRIIASLSVFSFVNIWFILFILLFFHSILFLKCTQFICSRAKRRKHNGSFGYCCWCSISSCSFVLESFEHIIWKINYFRITALGCVVIYFSHILVIFSIRYFFRSIFSISFFTILGIYIFPITYHKKLNASFQDALDDFSITLNFFR